VGSIDNDMAGTDMTIGCDTALQRIVQAVDTLSSTAASHQRDFVVEVMGRNCGWLALKGATATGADWVFIPENPAPVDWAEEMSSTLRRGKELGKRSRIIIVAEGAHDVTGKKISSEAVRQELDSRGFEARVTILGHIQRGGAPTAYDRQLVRNEASA
jgi:6-phosphofructokinase 1